MDSAEATLYTTIINYIRNTLLPSMSFVDGAHGLDHFYRVANTAKKISDGKGNLEAIEVACLLHDIVNYPKNHPDRKQSAQKAAEYAEKFLKKRECQPEFIQTVSECIRNHSYTAGKIPESWEAKCVQDADRLDAVGAIGIARCLYIGGSLGSIIMDLEDPLGLYRELDDFKYTLDHFQVKLGHLQYLMNTPTARSLARKASVLMEIFRHRMASGDPEAFQMAEYFYHRGRQGLPLYSEDDIPRENWYIRKFLQDVKSS